MSIRVVIAVVLMVICCFWALRRPLIGVCLNIMLFNMNLRVLGAGLQDIRFQFIATLALVASYLINREELLKVETPAQPPMKLLFAFLGICFITSAWAAVSPGHAFDSAFEFSKIVLFVWLMTKIIQTEQDLRIVIWVALAGVWYTSFMARWGVDWNWIDETEIGIATGGTGTHIMMFFPMMVIMAIFGSKWEKLATYVILPFVLDFLPVTPDGQRATFLALCTSMAFFWIFAPNRVRVRSIVPFGVAALLFIFVLVPPGYWEEMATILNPSSESSAASRSVINQASWQIAAEYPWGVGYNNYSLVSLPYIPEEYLSNIGTRDAHNSYLKVLCEFGVLGFVIWITTFFVTWLYFRKVRKTMTKDQPPTRLQLYALAFELGLIGITLSIYTHSYNDLDTLYWFVSLSCVLYNIHFRDKIAGQQPMPEIKPPHEKALEKFAPKKAKPEAAPVTARQTSMPRATDAV
jgi:O-antigen ligase